MSKKLTEGQRKVWVAAYELQQKPGPRPSYAEIAEKAGVTKTTVHTAIARLVALGYAQEDPNRRRSLFITSRPQTERWKGWKTASGTQSR